MADQLVQRPFTLLVRDIFHFNDGTTILDGSIIEGAPGPIGKCVCHVVLDGNEAGVIQVDGEMIPERSQGPHPEGFRSLVSHDLVPIRRETLLDQDCRLKCK